MMRRVNGRDHATFQSLRQRRQKEPKPKDRAGAIVESIPVNNLRTPPLYVPKDFMKMIYVSDGPAEGRLADSCICGYPTDSEDPDVGLVVWYQTGRLMYVHRNCVQGEDG